MTGDSMFCAGEIERIIFCAGGDIMVIFSDGVCVFVDELYIYDIGGYEDE